MKKLSASLRHWVFASLCLLLMSTPLMAASQHDGVWRYLSFPVNFSHFVIQTYSNGTTIVFDVVNEGDDIGGSPHSVIIGAYIGYIKNKKFRGTLLDDLKNPFSFFSKTLIMVFDDADTTRFTHNPIIGEELSPGILSEFFRGNEADKIIGIQ